MWFNKYKLMWLYLFFDLPVGTAKQRKAASDFRNFLLDNGFSMAQYSVYYKYAGEEVEQKRILQLVESSIPVAGHVEILTITDKQYEKIVSYSQGKFDKSHKKHNESYLLF